MLLLGEVPMRSVRLALALLLALPCFAQANKPASPIAGVLSTTELQQLMPPAVFFQGQLATTQMRNSFGARFNGGGLVLAGLVDTGGYSTAIRNRYQFYLLNDTPIEIEGKKITPGAYGCGFVQDGGLLIMDLGGNDLMRVPLKHDTAMQHPRPLQMLPGEKPDQVRLYLGRDYVILQHSR